MVTVEHISDICSGPLTICKHNYQLWRGSRRVGGSEIGHNALSYGRHLNNKRSRPGISAVTVWFMWKAVAGGGCIIQQASKETMAIIVVPTNTLAQPPPSLGPFNNSCYQGLPPSLPPCHRLLTQSTRLCHEESKLDGLKLNKRGGEDAEAVPRSLHSATGDGDTAAFT